jgi:hypothetical protein
MFIFSDSGKPEAVELWKKLITDQSKVGAATEMYLFLNPTEQSDTVDDAQSRRLLPAFMGKSTEACKRLPALSWFKLISILRYSRDYALIYEVLQSAPELTITQAAQYIGLKRRVTISDEMQNAHLEDLSNSWAQGPSRVVSLARLADQELSYVFRLLLASQRYFQAAIIFQYFYYKQVPVALTGFLTRLYFNFHSISCFLRSSFEMMIQEGRYEDAERLHSIMFGSRKALSIRLSFVFRMSFFNTQIL